MTIQTGDKLPAGSLKVMGPEGPQEFTISELFDGKKVVMFAVPGALSTSSLAIVATPDTWPANFSTMGP